MSGLDIRQLSTALRGGSLATVSLQGDIATAVEGQLSAIVTAANTALHAEAAARKTQLHADVLKGFKNGLRLANAMWGVRVYPVAGKAYDPAFEIRSSVPELVRVFTTGETIHAANGDWLAVPNPKYFKVLRRKVLQGDHGEFVAQPQWPDYVAASLGAAKAQFWVAPGGRRGFVYVKLGKQRIVIGWLVKQTVLGKRIRGLDLYHEIEAQIPASAAARFEDVLHIELRAAP